jgi:predicted Holliday junction resolvase-like endonuclease
MEIVLFIIMILLLAVYSIRTRAMVQRLHHMFEGQATHEMSEHDKLANKVYKLEEKAERSKKLMI